MTTSNGADAVRLDELAAPTDRTTLDASTSAHGLLRKLDGNAAHYLDGTGALSTPAGAGGGAVATDVIWDAKGDIAAATGADAAAKVAVGTDFLDVLTPDSSVANGLRWAKPRSALRPTGSLYETLSRTLGVGAVATIASQSVYLIAIELPSNLLITSISFFSSGTALSAGSNQLFGLYSSSLALLRGSNDDGATDWGSNTVKTLGLTSTFTTTYSGLYYLAILIKATTPPTLKSMLSGSQLIALAPAMGGVSDTGRTTLPNPVAAPSSAYTSLLYAYVS